MLRWFLFLLERHRLLKLVFLQVALGVMALELILRYVIMQAIVLIKKIQYLVLEEVIDLKKKVIIIIVVLALVLIVFGCIFITIQNTNKSANKEVSQVLTNTSNNLQNSHCLNNLCVNSMEIIYNKGQGEIKFTLQNTSQVPVDGNYLKLVFDNNQDLTYIYRYENMNSSDSISVVIEFQEEELIDVKDYEIKELSIEELNEFKNGEKGSEYFKRRY